MFCEHAAKAGIPRNLKQSGDKVQLLSHTVAAVAFTNLNGLWSQAIRIREGPLY